MKLLLLLATTFVFSSGTKISFSSGSTTKPVTKPESQPRDARALVISKAITPLLKLAPLSAAANIFTGYGPSGVPENTGLGGHGTSGSAGLGGQSVTESNGFGGHGISGSTRRGGQDVSGSIGFGGNGISDSTRQGGQDVSRSIGFGSNSISGSTRREGQDVSGSIGFGSNSISGSVGVEGQSPRFSLQAFQEPQYIANEIKKLTPVSLEELIDDEWLEFKMRYNKVYSSAEIESFRREIFIENRAKIAKFNQEYSEGKVSYVQQINNFGDLLNHEFNQLVNGFNQSTLPKAEIPDPTTYISSKHVVHPKSVDWREFGAVTPVKSQGLCASCWAFAAAGSLEGQWFRKTGQLEDISEQNFVDCTKSYGNDGCMGGIVDSAFEYVRQNRGIDGEESYPYEAKDGPCRFRPENIVAKCSGYVDLPIGDEKSLELAVATIGPIAVAINAGEPPFQFYSNGVYYDPKCKNKPDDMNHAVLVVGYGQEPNGQKYWMVKNSYGAQWGLGGYIKMAKDLNNHCGIANTASYPLV